MILIRLSGAGLVRHKVIAGMSGSPIYINDKLIGALGYGWPFENEPLAGVTPIHNMLAELNQPQGGVRSGLAIHFGRHDTQSAHSILSPIQASQPQQLMNPLSLGGFSPALVDVLGYRFHELGLVPVIAGNTLQKTKERPRRKIEPGGSLGVELMRGDLNAVAVGTATYIEGDKVLAFGHPLFRSGQLTAPAVAAEVHTIMSSVATSFKLATAVADVGAMVGDWQSCIVADTTKSAKMIPVQINVINQSIGHRESFKIEIIDSESFSPALFELAISQSILSASGSSQDTTIQIDWVAEIDAESDGLTNQLVQVSNTWFNPKGGLINPEALTPITELFNTQFGDPTVQSLIVNIDAHLERRTAEIERVYFAQNEVRPGETIRLSIVLNPYGKNRELKVIELQTPLEISRNGRFEVFVVAGSQAPVNAAQPVSLMGYLNHIQKKHRSTDLVVLVRMDDKVLQHRGKLLTKLPPSVFGVLDDESALAVGRGSNHEEIVIPTDWVLSGISSAQVPIKKE